MGNIISEASQKKGTYNNGPIIYEHNPVMNSLSVVSSVIGAVDVFHVVVQGENVGADVRTIRPGETVAVRSEIYTQGMGDRAGPKGA